MDTENNKFETPGQQTAGESGSAGAAAQNIMERGTEAFEQAEKAVSEVYDKTSRKVGETYGKARSYSSENPGKTILVALGIGVGLGFLLGASSHPSRSSRLAQPVINAFTDTASKFFR